MNQPQSCVSPSTVVDDWESYFDQLDEELDLKFNQQEASNDTEEIKEEKIIHKKTVTEKKTKVEKKLNHSTDGYLFKNPKTIKLPEKNQMLHWVDQFDSEQFVVILKKLTTLPGFDIKDLWLKEKSLRQTQVTIDEKKTKQNQSGSKKRPPKQKKIDLIRASTSIKINQKLIDSDNQILSNTKLGTHKQSFYYYKSMIDRLKTPEKKLEFKIILLKHLLGFINDEDKIDLENIVDLYFELISQAKGNSEIEQLIKQCENHFSKIKLDLIQFQMHQLSNRLPPLNNFSERAIQLDQWQMELLEIIDRNQSAIVCAPTSAGKTIISTYAATQGKKVIFVAPSEPLAAQIGGLFREILRGNVEIITNSYHLPAHNTTVLVGTPNAIESCIIDGHFVPEYAIFDEIHELNGNEGGSFERLIKLFNCPSLCLSATIKNIPQIKQWMEQLHNYPTHLIIQERRFINLQKHIWTNDRQIKHLHPISALTYENFLNTDVIDNQLAFTPADCYNLWLAIKQSYSSDQLLTVAPTHFFKKNQRLTLYDCFLYEKELIQFLQKNCQINQNALINVLNSFKHNDNNRETTIPELYDLAMSLKNKKMTPAIMFQLNSSNCEELYQKLVEYAENQQDKYVPYHGELLELKQNQYQAYVAQVDKFNKDPNLDQQTVAQRIKEYSEKNIERAISDVDDFLSRRKFKVQSSNQYDPETKRIIIEYIEKDQEENMQRSELHHVDIYQPHRDFCYTEEYLSDLSVAEVKWAIQQELKLRLQWDGWFLRGISRGIGLYVENLSSAYQRAVQSLAQQRKLAIVISDKSLAYGVNLPIKTCCLVGYNGINHFQPLIAQQMFGRAGRRGLDTEGHIVFVNVNKDEIMKGELSQINGNHPETPAIATYHQISPFVNHDRMTRLLSSNLNDFIQTGKLQTNYDQYDRSKAFIQECHLDNHLMTVFWALRNQAETAESFIKWLPLINQVTELREKQMNKLTILFKILVNIFEKKQISKQNEYQFNDLLLMQTNNPTVNAFVEFRINDTLSIVKKHELKNSILFMGNIIRLIYNFLSVDSRYEQLSELLMQIFSRLKDLIDKYTF